MITRYPTVRILLAATTLLGFQLAAVCQSGNEASITGVVTDRSGARVPGATVTVVRFDTGRTLTTTANSEGMFRFSVLSSGTYRLSAQHPGFAPYVRASLQVTAGARISLTLPLSVAGVNQSITVEAGDATLQSTRPDVSSTVDSRAVQDLPVNGRNFSDFVLVTGGVGRDARVQSDFSFSGQRQMNSVLIDGLDDTDTFFGTSLGHNRAPYQFSEDAVQEFQVNTNSYSAEFGRAGGGVINAITKSGTNDLHGSAFWFFRDRTMNANDPVNKLNHLPRSPYHFNNFGATLGGPMIRNRAFFFADYEGQRSRIQNNTLLALPATFHTASDPFVAGFQERALAYLQERATPWIQPADENVWLAKADWYFNPRHSLTARWNRQRLTTSTVTGSQISSEHTNPVFENTDSVGVTLTSAFSATKVNVLRFGYESGGQSIPPGSRNAEANVSEGGQLVLTVGRNQNAPSQTYLRRYEISEKLSFVRGRHTVKLGIDELWDRTTFLTAATFAGSYQFQSLEGFGRSLSGTPKPVRGDTYQQAFSTGHPDGVTVEPDSIESAAFVEDEWRLRPTLTLNLGVRYDIQWMESPPVKNPSVTLAGAGLTTNSLPIDKNNIAPRVGVAWLVPHTRSLILRSGYGTFYARTLSIMNARAFFQNGISVQPRSLSGSNATGTLIPAYPNNLCGRPSDPLGCAPPASGASSPAITLFAPNLVEPYVQQANVSMEFAATPNTVVSSTYVMSRGTHLLRTRDINLAGPMQRIYIAIAQTPSVLSYDTYVQSRPIAGFERIWQFSSDANSDYNGLILQVRRRFTRRAQFTASYTFSKVIDDNPDPSTTNFGNSDSKMVQDGLHPRGDWSVGINDQRHRFVATAIWDLAYGDSLPPIARRLLHGWQISGIITAQSGLPYSGLVRSDLNNDANSATDRTPGAPRNLYRMPAAVSVDPRISRSVRLHEHAQIEFIAEAFNVFNRANITSVRNIQYALANSPTVCGVAGSPCLLPQNGGLLAFGTPISSSGPRIIQLAAKIRF